MPSSNLTFAVMSLESIALVAIAGFAGGLAIALFMLFVRRSPTAMDPHNTAPVPVTHREEHSERHSRRLSPRRAGRHVDVQVTDADQVESPIPGWVIDRSAGGLAVGFPHPIDAGVILSIRPLEAQSMVPWVQVEVRQSTEMPDGNWRLGCKFVRTPPYSVMMLFG
jgi:hypothetical protein